MNHDTLDFSTEDEGVDEDMMFEFEQELDTRLTLEDQEAASSSACGGAIARGRSPVVFAPERPQNPVASVLQRTMDVDDQEFASLSASPFCDYESSSSSSVLRMANAIGLSSASSDAPPTSLSAPPSYGSDKSPCFDFNGRRKRKFFDDSCCVVTPRVRPLAKRAKSFSCVSDVLLPSSSSSSSSSSALPGTGTGHRDLMLPASVFASIPSASSSAASPSSSSFRSESIQIPHRALRPSARHPHRCSSSGPSSRRGSGAIGGKCLVEAGAASSDPLVGYTATKTSSWNASVEYFCRRSLDISSPLRSRFRELVVGSAGRAGSLQSP